MGIPTKQSHLTPQQWTFTGVTIGRVVDTNDPQQMGRVRAVCLTLNDDPSTIITNIPWASYVSPFGGTVQAGTRGVENETVSGPTSYGLWAIPKVGSQVIIMCLDGNPQTRVWIGCLHTSLATHTMPHGRFSYKEDDNFPSGELPAGPVSSFETEIQPLYKNLREAFATAPEGANNFEFQTRGADFQVSGVGLGQLNATLSRVEDDQDEATSTTLNLSRQGYQTSRIAPNQYTDLTPRNLDNMVTSIVSPGFHAFSMDDRAENCRVRIRTTSGNQIIFDDSNERIYISTATGENWIELDEKGNIDVYTSGKISAHSEQDINFTTDKSFRVYAKAGIHLNSDQEIRVNASKDISIKSAEVMRINAQNNVLVESTAKDVHLKAAGDLFQTAQSTIHVLGNTLIIQARGEGSILSGGEFTVQASGNANIVGSKVNLNSGGSAASASEASISETKLAFFTNRVPDHEPWARVDTEVDTGITPQFTYTSSEVGKKRRVTTADGTTSEELDILRGTKWRR